MPHITINGENAPLCAKSLAENKIRFTEFDEKCETCGKSLDEAIAELDALICECGKKYIIHSTEKPAGKPSKEKPMKPTKSEKPAETEKPVKNEKPTKTEKSPRDIMSNTLLVATGDGNEREGSGCSFVLKFFKKPTVPSKIVDKIIEAWRKERKMPASFKKSPRGYIMWHVIHMVKKGGLKKTKA